VMSEPSAAQQIEEKIGSLDDWRGKTLAQLRNLIREADPDVIEDVSGESRPIRSAFRPGSMPASSARARYTRTR